MIDDTASSQGVSSSPVTTASPPSSAQRKSVHQKKRSRIKVPLRGAMKIPKPKKKTLPASLAKLISKNGDEINDATAIAPPTKSSNANGDGVDPFSMLGMSPSVDDKTQVRRVKKKSKPQYDVPDVGRNSMFSMDVDANADDVGGAWNDGDDDDQHFMGGLVEEIEEGSTSNKGRRKGRGSKGTKKKKSVRGIGAVVLDSTEQN